jgi:hypothetical protein
LIKAITGVFPVKKNYGYIAKIPISNWKQQKQTTIYQILSNIQQNYSALKQLDYSQFKMLLRFKTNLNSDKWSSSQRIEVDSGMVGAEFITLYDKEVIEPMYYDSNKVNSKSFIQNSVKIEKVVEIDFVFYHD